MTVTRAARATALTAAALAATLLAAGGTATATTATTAARHHRATVVVHTTSKHKVVAPATTHPGTARLKNTGSQAIFLVTPRHGAGPKTLAHDLNADNAGGLIKHFTVADALPARATTYLHLARGTYYLVDTSRDSFTAAAVRTLHVRGTTVNATTPKARSIVVTSRNTLNSPAKVGTSSELRTRNTSTRLHELLLWPVAAKTTDSAVAAFVAKPSVSKLYTVVSGEPELFAMLSPTLHATSSQHSKAGRYLLLTFAFTPHTSEPHLSAGQARLVTVK